MHKLQVLHHELDIADRAFAQLDLTPEPPLLEQIGLDFLLHRPDAVADNIGWSLKEQRGGPGEEGLAEGDVAGDDPGLQQRCFSQSRACCTR